MAKERVPFDHRYSPPLRLTSTITFDQHHLYSERRFRNISISGRRILELVVAANYDNLNATEVCLTSTVTVGPITIHSRTRLLSSAQLAHVSILFNHEVRCNSLGCRGHSVWCSRRFLAHGMSLPNGSCTPGSPCRARRNRKPRPCHPWRKQ